MRVIFTLEKLALLKMYNKNKTTKDKSTNISTSE